MTRRILGIMAAAILALVGTVSLVGFVAGAEERALEGEQLMEVYVVSEPIPAGTTGAEVDERIAVEEVPIKVRALDAVDNLVSLADRVAAVDLQPGEQLLDSRFIEISEFTDREIGVQVPDDMLEVTVPLDPHRAIGGLLEPGQTVAVLASFDESEQAAGLVEVNGQEVALPQTVADESEQSYPASTDLLLRKALVSAVQDTRASAGFGDEDEENSRLNTAPEGQLLVTLALDPANVERVVFAAEQGRLWFAIERETVPEVDDAIRTRGNVYDDPEEIEDLDELDPLRRLSTGSDTNNSDTNNSDANDSDTNDETDGEEANATSPGLATTGSRP